MWIVRTIRARYQQSILGGLWAVIQPAATVAIFTVIFTMFLHIDTGGIPYVAFSFTAMVPWTLFATSITDMSETLVQNMNLVSKIYFPREILPIAALFARVFDFLIALCVLFIILSVYKIPLNVNLILILPFIIIVQLALALGIGLLGSSLFVFYRDIRHVVALGMQIWFYATPIIYPLETVPANLLGLYQLNPMVGIMQAYRDILLYQRLPGPSLLYSLGVAVFILLLGYGFFKRVEFQFADVV